MESLVGKEVKIKEGCFISRYAWVKGEDLSQALVMDDMGYEGWVDLIDIDVVEGGDYD